MDTGDVYSLKQHPSLWKPRLILAPTSHMGADLMVQTLENLENIVPKKQDHDLATYAPFKEDGLIDFSHSAKIFIIWFEELILGLAVLSRRGTTENLKTEIVDFSEEMQM